MKINIDNMSEDELRALNREIVRRLEMISYGRRKMQLMAFRIGDRVEFDTERGTVVGTVVRINQKTASIETDAGPGYRVSPSFLRKIVGEAVSDQGNLFQFPERPSKQR